MVVVIPVTGPNGAAKIHVGGRKFAARADLPAAAPVDPPLPVTVPWTSAMTPSLRRVSSSGWRPSPKRMPGTSSTAPPAPVSRSWRIVTSVTCAVACRMMQRPAGADVVAGHGEAEILAAQRIEARLGMAVGDRHAAVDRQVALVETPAAGGVAHLHRDGADRPPRVGEGAADAAALEGAAQAVRTEDDRRLGLTKLKQEVGRGELPALGDLRGVGRHAAAANRRAARRG